MCNLNQNGALWNFGRNTTHLSPPEWLRRVGKILRADADADVPLRRRGAGRPCRGDALPAPPAPQPAVGCLLFSLPQGRLVVHRRSTDPGPPACGDPCAAVPTRGRRPPSRPRRRASSLPVVSTRDRRRHQPPALRLCLRRRGRPGSVDAWPVANPLPQILWRDARGPEDADRTAGDLVPRVVSTWAGSPRSLQILAAPGGGAHVAVGLHPGARGGYHLPSSARSLAPPLCGGQLGSPRSTAGCVRRSSYPFMLGLSASSPPRPAPRHGGGPGSGVAGAAAPSARQSHDRYLVDSASSHMLVSKIKPCMSKYKQFCTVKLRMAH